jgi:twinkle protein
MGVIVLKDQPCLDKVKCGSSDARQVYADGGSHCFSCGQSFKAVEDEIETEVEVKAAPEKDLRLAELKDIHDNYAVRGFIDRQIKKTTNEFFGVKVGYDSQGNIDTHYYPYMEGDNLSYKVRKLPKTFSSIGKYTGLFGKDKFTSGGKRLIITEGEIDALTIAQASADKYNGVIYPVVSMGAATNTKNLITNREWIRSFGEVVLCFDEDKAGKEAIDEAIRIIGLDKVKITKLPLKDANDVYCNAPNGSDTLMRAIWDAETYKPAGIMTTEDLKAAMNDLADEPFVTYPPCMAGVQTKLKGMRLRQIALYVSGTGSGKSTLIREIILHLLEITSDKIGIISLEETPGETARSLASMHLKRNLANEEISRDDLNKGFDNVFETDRVIVLDHQGSINDKSIVDQMEYMALMGCKYLFIDHITILVSEGASELKGNEAIDKIMNDLLRVVKKHEIHIGLVSHLRKTATGGKSFEEGQLPSLDDIKGSGSIKQVCMDIIGFARNMRSQDEGVRNSILMEVLKCRTTGLTGIVEGAVYDFKTGRLTRASEVPDEEFKDEEFEIIPAGVIKEVSEPKLKLVTLENKQGEDDGAY